MSDINWCQIRWQANPFDRARLQWPFWTLFCGAVGYSPSIIENEDMLAFMAFWTVADSTAARQKNLRRDEVNAGTITVTFADSGREVVLNYRDKWPDHLAFLFNPFVYAACLRR